MILNAIVVLLIICPAAFADHHNPGPVVGWRTDHTGRYPDAAPPTTWSTKDNVAWVTPLDAWSNATPVVIGDRVITCAEQFTLVCVSAADGNELWRVENTLADAIPKGDRPARAGTHGNNGYSSATPVSDGEHVWALFGNGVVACYDMTGKRQWIKFLQLPANGWGHSSSPALVDGKLVVQIVDVIGMDAATGDEVWRYEMGGAHSFGTPIATRVGDLAVIITPTGDFLRASDGHVYARRLAKLEYNTPIVHDGVVYFITGDSRAFTLAANDDRTLAIEPKWRCGLPRDRYYSSPLYHNGLIYATHRGEKLTVIDAEKGEVVYSQEVKLSEVGGSNRVYSSPTFAGNHVYLTGLEGTTVVIRPGREFVKAARNSLPRTRASPVFVGNSAYIRAGKKLFCIRESSAQASAK